MKFRNFMNSRKLPWAIAGLSTIITIIIFPFLPSQIPMHFNVYDIVDDYSNKLQIFLFPLLQFVIVFCTGREKVKYILTHSKRFLSDIQYNWLVSGLCLLLVIAEVKIVSAVF